MLKDGGIRYRDQWLRVNAISLVCSAIIVLAFVQFVTSVAVPAVVDRLVTGHPRPSDAALLDALAVVSGLSVLTFVAAYVLFLMFMHRACTNAYALMPSAETLDYTPGQVVGLLLVPVIIFPLLVVAPYRAIGKIWFKSRAVLPELLALWGEAAVLKFVFLPLTSRFSYAALSEFTLGLRLQEDRLYHLCDLLLAAFTLLLVTSIHRDQRWHYETGSRQSHEFDTE